MKHLNLEITLDVLHAFRELTGNADDTEKLKAFIENDGVYWGYFDSEEDMKTAWIEHHFGQILAILPGAILESIDMDRLFIELMGEYAECEGYYFDGLFI